MHIFTQPIGATYTGTDASIEILIMLLGAGLIGYFMHYLRCAIRGCCHGAGCERCSPGLQRTAVAAAAPVLVPAAPIAPMKRDDLELLEGIGPKVCQVLNDAQILSFAQIAAMTPAALKAILERAGDRFRVLQTESWPVQAALARDGKLKELKEYQDFLVAGREPGAH